MPQAPKPKESQFQVLCNGKPQDFEIEFKLSADAKKELEDGANAELTRVQNLVNDQIAKLEALGLSDIAAKAREWSKEIVDDIKKAIKEALKSLEEVKQKLTLTITPEGNCSDASKIKINCPDCGDQEKLKGKINGLVGGPVVTVSTTCDAGNAQSKECTATEGGVDYEGTCQSRTFHIIWFVSLSLEDLLKPLATAAETASKTLAEVVNLFGKFTVKIKAQVDDVTVDSCCCPRYNFPKPKTKEKKSPPKKKAPG